MAHGKDMMVNIPFMLEKGCVLLFLSGVSVCIDYILLFRVSLFLLISVK